MPTWGSMPYASNEGVRIFWEGQGKEDGEPLLMIMGLTFTHKMWGRLWPGLAERYRVILFDNRGVGRSDAPLGPYSIPQMAQDAACVLEAAGYQSAHVIGASMGGMIAQELALRYPEKVRSLMLGCTTYGGVRFRRPKLWTFRKMLNPRMTIEERILRTTEFLYGEGTPWERIAEDVAIRKAEYPKPQGIVGQVASFLTWSSWSRLDEIACPTLLVHGTNDQLVPYANSEVLARRIKDAQLIALPGAGHVFLTDEPERTLALTLEFLDALRA